MVLRLRLSNGGGKGQGDEGSEEELGKHFEIGDGFAETVGVWEKCVGWYSAWIDSVGFCGMGVGKEPVP